MCLNSFSAISFVWVLVNSTHFWSVQLITRWILKTEQHSFPLNRYANVDSFKLKIGAFVGPIYLNLNTCFLGNYSLEIWLLKEITSSSYEKKNWNYLKNSMISMIFITSCFFLLSVGMIDLVTQQSANYLIYSLPKQGTIWRPTIPFFCNYFFYYFLFP